MFAGEIQHIFHGTAPLRARCASSSPDAVEHAADKAEAVRPSSFTELVPSIPESVLAALSERGVHAPTPIQSAAMERIDAGESVVLHAQTGSGKTLTFLLPALARLGLAGMTQMPSDDELMTLGRVLVVTPTRELAVQLANEAALVLPAPLAVQIVVIGVKPDPYDLVNAAVITCTAPEMLEVMNQCDMTPFLYRVRVLILDEMDALLPNPNVYSRSDEIRKKKNYEKGRPDRSLAETLLRKVVFAAYSPDLQIIGASATASKPTRQKLARLLRADKQGRFEDKQLDIVRPAETLEQDLSAVPRAIVIPEGVRHYYIPLEQEKEKGKKKSREEKLLESNKKYGTKLTVKQKEKLKLKAKRQQQQKNRSERTSSPVKR
eukprot:gnl/TRDRNA2_/TRDRNA2_65114_c1_seq1.p1 gnl/TRDRNA2_/TRDRNA2_65114_c1~~gnl/TRDRNA2_/TRDRNA2_65114_c1_seq1.p1  ORF type:complete len:406 (+),score=81.26 gnl/TRDRNA2_/TRDRNA2_65114_c1_seq1:88-1218(+)